MTEVRWVRAPEIGVLDGGDRLRVLRRDGRVLAFDGPSADLARALLELLDAPRDRAELLEGIAALTGGALEDPRPIDEALGHLEAAGGIERVAKRGGAIRAARRVVLAASGAVAALHTPAIVLGLLGRGYAVRVVATKKALRFFTAAAIESLTHQRVVRGIWDRAPDRIVPHIELAEWAELLLVAPASAATISRLARGASSDIVSAVALATRAPILVAPSMNAAMYASPAVQRNLQQLREDGATIIHPAFGVEVADPPAARTRRIGPAPPPEVLLALVELALNERPAALRADDWDRIYRETPLADLPFAGPDPDFTRLLEGASGRILEIGCGPASVARVAAERGLEVVATDVSRAALEIARAGSDRLVLILDDIRDTRLASRFELIVDRGCLHVLAPADRPRYARSIARLLGPGGRAVIKAFARAPADRSGVFALSRAEIEALFPAQLLEISPCRFDARSAEDDAWWIVLEAPAAGV